MLLIRRGESHEVREKRHLLSLALPSPLLHLCRWIHALKGGRQLLLDDGTRF